MSVYVRARASQKLHLGYTPVQLLANLLIPAFDKSSDVMGLSTQSITNSNFRT